MIEYSILLEAIDPQNNIWRSYCLEAGRDLFGNWFVNRSYGRKGAKGKHDQVALHDRKQAITYINECLKARKNSISRTGVPYVVKEVRGDWPEICLEYLRENPEVFFEPNDTVPW